MPSSAPKNAVAANSTTRLLEVTGGDQHSPPPGAADRFELEPGEKVVASCRFDLDANLRFTDGSILLTDRRLLADCPASADGEPSSAEGSRSWPLDPTTGLDLSLIHISEPTRLM
jgi:hypothetical protein